MQPTEVRFATFTTAAGFCGIAWNARGIVRFLLPVERAASAERLLRRRLGEALPAVPPPPVEAAVAAAQAYFAGVETDFTHCALDLGPLDPLMARIYAAVRKIGWGQTTTYGALAEAVGAGPQGAREVGQAMARNPVPLIIPCHRVLAAGGRIGGFSAPGGAATKLRMLELEGLRMTPEPSAQLAFGF